MLSNLHDIWVITNEYRGTGYILVLYAISVIFLLITEKNRKNRFLMVYMPLSLILLIYFPVFYHIYVVYLDDSGTYYRIFWLLPMLTTTAYAACKAIYRFRRIGTIVVCALIVFCGGYAYSAKSGANISRAQNLYHIPQYVVELGDAMTQEIDGVNVYAIVPTEMLFYIRQYDSNICLLYGRETVEPKWQAWIYYKDFYNAFEVAETIDLDALLEMTRNNDAEICTYFVIPADKPLSKDPAECGLEVVKEVDGYVLYRDTVAVELIKEMFKGTAYEQ